MRPIDAAAVWKWHWKRIDRIDIVYSEIVYGFDLAGRQMWLDFLSCHRIDKLTRLVKFVSRSHNVRFIIIFIINIFLSVFILITIWFALLSTTMSNCNHMSMHWTAQSCGKEEPRNHLRRSGIEISHLNSMSYNLYRLLCENNTLL